MIQYTLASAGLTTATTAYTSGDVLGTEMTMTVGTGYGARGRGVYVNSIVAVDASAVLAAFDLFFFSAASTPAADNAANSWSDANMANLVGVIPAATVYTSALNVAVVAQPASPVALYAPSGVLYVVAVARTGNAVFAAGATSVTYKISATLD